MEKTVRVAAEGQTFRNQATMCVGTGRMDLALQEEYQQHLSLVQDEIGFRYIRGHGLFSDQMGIYREIEQDGKKIPFYNFTYLDRIYDAYLQKGIKPFVELGFMPSALASGEQTIFYWKGNVTLPKDIQKWQQLVQKTLQHWLDRYGKEEVESWLFEVWNEPNIDFLAGDLAEYCSFYQDTVTAVKQIDAALQVGGPSICGVDVDRWLNGFFAYCEENQVPLDFVTRHCYCAKEPHSNGEYVHHHMNEPENMSSELKETRRIMEKYSVTRTVPLHITEFNTSYTPLCLVHDTVYNAAYVADILSRAGDDADSYSYWTFSDVFEEQDVPKAEFYGGFGLVAAGGVRKPAFYTFQFFARAGSELLYRDAHMVITKNKEGKYQIIAWNMTAQGLVSDEADQPLIYHIFLPQTGTGAEATELRTCVDSRHGNAAGSWCDLGSPRTLDAACLKEIRELSLPERTSQKLAAAGGYYETQLILQGNMVMELRIKCFAKNDQPYHGFEKDYGFGLDIK